MHRSASVVSFRGDDGSEGSLHDVHCIGSVNELKKEKKGKRSSTFKWLKKEARVCLVSFDETGVEWKCKVGKRVRLGDSVTMRAREVDPFSGRLTFAQVR